MANKLAQKLYIPVDAIDKHENFPIWYEDGFEFCVVESDWADEKSRVIFNGPLGGMLCGIKPDFRALTYDVSVDRWTYTLKTMTIFKHYFFEGMLWQMYGSISNGKAWFINENTCKKDVYINKVKDFKGRGPCYEVRVRDISKLRPAAGATVAMMIKESYKGLSIGEPDDSDNFFTKMKRYAFENGYTYEKIQELEAKGKNKLVIPEKYRK